MEQHTFDAKEFVLDRDTEKVRCRRCGHVVLEERELDYPYVCLFCDENMYGFETYVGDPHTDDELKELIALTEQIYGNQTEKYEEETRQQPAIWDWSLMDSDCCQYMRRTSVTHFDMIECVHLDTTEEDLAKGLHKYVVVTGGIDLDDLSYEEMLDAIALYGYKESDFDSWCDAERASMVAECRLEEDLLADAYTIAAFNSFPETKTFIEKWIGEHKMDESVVL